MSTNGSKMTTEDIVDRLRQLPILAREPDLKFKRIRKSKFPSYFEWNFTEFYPCVRIADMQIDMMSNDQMIIEPAYSPQTILDDTTVRVFEINSDYVRMFASVFTSKDDDAVFAIFLQPM